MRSFVLAWTRRERSLCVWMHRASQRRWVVGMLSPISRAGDGWLWYAIVGCLPWVDSVHGESAAVQLFCLGANNVLMYKIIKRSIARPRPFEVVNDVRQCVRPLDEFSFPSGHTLHAVACSAVLTVYYPRFGLVLWPLTALIALSRVVLGLHYPSDVLVGAMLGATTAAISFTLL